MKPEPSPLLVTGQLQWRRDQPSSKGSQTGPRHVMACGCFAEAWMQRGEQACKQFYVSSSMDVSEFPSHSRLLSLSVTQDGPRPLVAGETHRQVQRPGRSQRVCHGNKGRLVARHGLRQRQQAGRKDDGHYAGCIHLRSAAFLLPKFWSRACM